MQNTFLLPFDKEQAHYLGECVMMAKLRAAMTSSRHNDTSLSSQAERDQTVAANEEGSVRTTAEANYL